MGDSFIRIRMYRDTPTKKIEIKKGMRQPQLPNASRLIEFWTRRITASEMNSPNVAVIWIKPV